MLSSLCKCAVVSVGYRLAPKYRFPAAVNDAFEALKWVSNHYAHELGFPRDSVAVIGVSAGGNLAAIVSILARDQGIPLKYQILITPVLGFDPYSSSARLYRRLDPLFTFDTIVDFTLKYLGDLKEAFNPLFTPILSRLENLPPALIITAEKDPLRDQGEAYAEKLREAGVPVISIRLNGIGHRLDPTHLKLSLTIAASILRDVFTAKN